MKSRGGGQDNVRGKKMMFWSEVNAVKKEEIKFTAHKRWGW